MTTHVDPVTLELIKGMMRSARLEMEALIERAAMSPFIREKKDYFTAFFDNQGRLLYGTNIPLGGISSTVSWSSTRRTPCVRGICTGTTTAMAREVASPIRQI